jgi:hypothetical protein
MGRTKRGWAAGERNGPSEIGRRPGAVFGLEKKRRESWAGLETGEGERERLRVLFFLNFCFKPFQTLKLFKPYFFQVFKLF